MQSSKHAKILDAPYFGRCVALDQSDTTYHHRIFVGKNQKVSRRQHGWPWVKRTSRKRSTDFTVESNVMSCLKSLSNSGCELR